MRITYESAFKQAKKVTLAGAVVLVVATTTGCSDSSSSNQTSVLTEKINEADSGCSSAGDYCTCMKDDLASAISSALGNGDLTQVQADDANAKNIEAYNDCNNSNGSDKSFWTSRIS